MDLLEEAHVEDLLMTLLEKQELGGNLIHLEIPVFQELESMVKAGLLEIDEPRRITLRYRVTRMGIEKCREIRARVEWEARREQAEEWAMLERMVMGEEIQITPGAAGAEKEMEIVLHRLQARGEAEGGGLTAEGRARAKRVRAGEEGLREVTYPRYR